MNERKHPKSVTVLSILLAVTVFLLILSTIFSATVLLCFSPSELLQLAAVKNVIENNFIFDYDEESLTAGTMAGMVEKLGDPYSRYLTTEEYEEFTYEVLGEFGGIGVTMRLDDEKKRIVVSEIQPDSPAKKEGVLEQDEILAIDGEPVSTDIEKTARSVRGEVGSRVTITFHRPSEDRTFDLTFKREKLTLNSVTAQRFDDTLGYLRISAFNSTTAEETLNALKDLEQEGVTELILDLRDNIGGSVKAAEKIADYFLDEGTIYQTISKSGKSVMVKSDAHYDPIPMVVLVNDGTASASELLCGALQDRGRAILVGDTTFGKGIIQKNFHFPDGVLTLTFAEYATPNGTHIHEKGITPDLPVSLSEEDRYRWPTLTVDQDPQLLAAIKAIV